MDGDRLLGEAVGKHAWQTKGCNEENECGCERRGRYELNAPDTFGMILSLLPSSESSSDMMIGIAEGLVICRS